MSAKIRFGLSLAALTLFGGALLPVFAQDQGGAAGQSSDMSDQQSAQDLEQQQQQFDQETTDSNIPTPQPDKTQQNQQPLEFTDKTTQAFSELRPLLDSKQWDAALDLVNKTIAENDPNSYDMAVLLDTKAKLLIEGKNDYAGAIQPWEQCLQLYKAHPEYFKRNDIMSMLVNLAQINYQLVATSKDKAVQEQGINRAIAYMRVWMQAKRHPGVDQVQLYATLLYYKAVADPSHINMAALRQAGKVAQLGLELTTVPRPGFYQLLVAVSQQEGDLKKAADYLQLLVTIPGEKSQWKNYYQELVAIYNNLAGDSDKNPRQQRVYYADAINSLERAQSLGYLKQQTDNYNLVSMYYAVGQFGRAIDLLNTGLHDGGIKDSESMWKDLSYFYQEEGQNFQAIDALKEAARRYPRDGGLEFTISQIYNELNQEPQAFAAVEQAIREGGLGDHEFTAYQLYAWLAYSLKHYNRALKAIEACERLPGPAVDKAEMLEMRAAVLKAQQVEQQTREAQKQAQELELKAREAGRAARSNPNSQAHSASDQNSPPEPTSM